MTTETRITALRWLTPGQRFKIAATGREGVLIKTNECRALVHIDGDEESVAPGTEVILLQGTVQIDEKRGSIVKEEKKSPTEPVIANPLGKCLCGCGEKTSGSKFKPGHDARFHGRVRRLQNGKLTLEDLKTEIGQTNYALSTYETAVTSHK